METIRNTFWPECAEKVSTPLVVEENSCDCEVFKASSVADTESPEYFSNWWVFQMSFLIAWRPQTQCFIALWFWQRSLRHIHQNLGKCYQIICITGCTPPGVCCFVIWVKWPFYFKQPVHLGEGGRGGSSTGFKPTLKCNICLSTGRHPTAFGVPGRTYRVEECPAGFCRDGHMAGRVQ